MHCSLTGQGSKQGLVKGSFLAQHSCLVAQSDDATSLMALLRPRTDYEVQKQ